MSEPLVSLVIPIYKVEEYLERCLDSVVAQTYRPIQAILINDGSPDNCQEIIDRYVDKHPDVFETYWQKNGGLSKARNAGLERVRGDWVCMVDSDDYIEPDYVAHMLEIALETNVDIVVCNFFLERNNKHKVVFPLMWRPREMSGKAAAKQSLDLLTMPNFAWNKLYATKLFREPGMKYPGILYEDIAVAVKILIGADRIQVTPKPLYHYCLRKTSITGSFGPRNVDGYLSAIEMVGSFLVEKKLLPEWNSNWMRFLRTAEIQMTLQAIFQSPGLSIKERHELLKDLRANIHRVKKEVSSAVGESELEV